tara:strand:+ start:1310 stop:1501 length:192 start_codon:yes stop_codon:yes gene_type:complete
MTTMTIISIYLVIGVACSLCFDIMMEWTGQTKETGPPTTYERIMWITLWPVFVLIFIFGSIGK